MGPSEFDYSGLYNADEGGIELNFTVGIFRHQNPHMIPETGGAVVVGAPGMDAQSYYSR
jgi:hypothetical protein